MSVLEHKDDLSPWTVFSSQRTLDTLAENLLDMQLSLKNKSAFTETQFANLDSILSKSFNEN